MGIFSYSTSFTSGTRFASADVFRDDKAAVEGFVGTSIRRLSSQNLGHIITGPSALRRRWWPAAEKLLEDRGASSGPIREFKRSSWRKAGKRVTMDEQSGRYCAGDVAVGKPCPQG